MPTKKRVVVVAGRIFDSKTATLSAGPHAIVIEGDRIVSVGPAAAVQPVAGEQRIDPAIIKLTIRFVDDDPAKLDTLSRYIEKL